MTEQTKRTWAEIHLDRLERNYYKLRALAPNSKFAGLVKANAYGHGTVAVAKKLEELGADYLLVAALDEAQAIRKSGVKTPILILGYTPVEELPHLLELDLVQTVYDLEQAKAFSQEAVKLSKNLRCHLKADTGMSRLGILCDEPAMDDAVKTLAEMAALPGLDAEGIFMHFADADCCPEYSEMQISRFRTVLEKLEHKGVTFAIRHCCAGAATLNYPEVHFEMIRPGILLYGHMPDHACDGMIELEPVMELKTRIASVKRLPKGTCISYGRTHTLERDSLVAAVPIGYGDGLFRLLSGKQEMLVRGKRVPQIGRVCMDMCMLDVTDVPGVQVGDEVTVFGRDLPIEEKADAVGTITYELLCAVSRRVPRIYLK
ncbi:MAG: alanine racemase [Oscillospiraceae bacterium]|nr:alanine racemase [Oscillospiraceae bacterium]